jgi:hypothetical protein
MMVCVGDGLVEVDGNEEARRMAGLLAGMTVQAKAALSEFYDTQGGGIAGDGPRSITARTVVVVTATSPVLPLIFLPAPMTSSAG